MRPLAVHRGGIPSCTARVHWILANFIVYGQELVAPIDVVLGRPGGVEYRNMDDFVEQKLRAMEQAHALVRECLNTASARTKRYYDIDVRSREFTPGSWVWMYSPRRYVGRSPKWQRNYSGPFLVIRRSSFVHVLCSAEITIEELRKSLCTGTN